jgi:hypothetical protein
MKPNLQLGYKIPSLERRFYSRGSPRIKKRQDRGARWRSLSEGIRAGWVDLRRQLLPNPEPTVDNLGEIAQLPDLS